MAVVPDILHLARARSPHGVAIRELGDPATARALTFGDVDDRASRLAKALGDAGALPGDRVALLAFNEVEYLEIQLATMRAGLVLVPLNVRLSPVELRWILDDCSPTVLISGAGMHDAGAALAPQRHLELGRDGTYERALAAATPTDHGLLDADSAATILYTSGTTGRPKGAVISNHALVSRIMVNLVEYRVRPDDVFLQCLPLFHIASTVSWTYAMAGATNLVVRTFDPDVVLREIAAHQVTSALMVPTMINTILHHPDVDSADLRSLRLLAYGASSISPSVLERAISVFGCDFLQLFGMTETSGCSILRPEDHDPIGRPELLASAGTESLGFEVRIVDDDDIDVADGVVGEIITRGPALMSGYWNAPDATAAALRGGWMHTGDLGRREHGGYLFVTDRKKDMIVTGGENVYPREVEDVLHEHPGVLEAAVIGVPDERWGERVHAVVVPCAPADRLGDLQEFTRARLAAYKVPKTIEIAVELPRNATGKVRKTDLRAPYWADHDRGIN